MSSWLLEVSGNFLSVEAIICYLVFSDQQLAIALLDMISFFLPRLSGELPYGGSGYQEHKGLRTLPSTMPHARRGSLKQFQQIEVSSEVEARTQPETWELSINWNTTALKLATFLSLLLALVALGWSTAGSYSELIRHVIEPLNISILTISKQNYPATQICLMLMQKRWWLAWRGVLGLASI